MFCIDIDKNEVDIMPYGKVKLLGVFGDELTIIESAKISYYKEDNLEKYKNDPNAVKDFISRLLSREHTSPFEHVEARFHLEMPIFVQRQHIRHRMASCNEISGRYTVMDCNFYIPPFDRLEKTDSYIDKSKYEEDVKKITEYYEKTKEFYEYLLERGYDKELARTILPLSTYTSMYWKIDFNNLLFRYFNRRLLKSSQFEIRQIAKAMFLLLEDKFPNLFSAYREWLNSKYPGNIDSEII